MYLLTMTLKQIKGLNLKRLREERNLKQWQIAEMINAKETNVSAMEKGKRSISDRVINILCEKLNIQSWEFFVTSETPIVLDEREKEHLFEYREAGKLLIADKINSYTAFILRETKHEKKEEDAENSISENN